MAFRVQRNGTEPVPYRIRPPDCYPGLNHAPFSAFFAIAAWEPGGKSCPAGPRTSAARSTPLRSNLTKTQSDTTLSGQKEKSAVIAWPSSMNHRLSGLSGSSNT